MIKLLLLLLICTTAAQSAFAQPRGAARSGDLTAVKRVALVVGNSKYAESPLKNPANDARDMAKALRGLGFDVIEKIDVGQRDLNRAIADFGSRLTVDGVALFYYAGHGIQMRGKNYLVPVDAQIASESAVRAEAVDVDAVLDQMVNSELNIVILDACRNNPFERRFRSVGGGLAQMDAPRGTLLAYATSPGKTASDGAGSNGIYTQELLKLMQTPSISVEQVFKEVRRSVQAITGNNQTPWESSSLTGDFYFKPQSATAPAVVVRQAEPQQQPSAQGRDASAPPASVEEDVWRQIKDSTRIADFAEYLFSYPSGRYVQAAMVKTGGGNWATDASSNCKLWASRIEGVQGRWSGACVNGKGQGQGEASWTNDNRRATSSTVLSGGLEAGKTSGRAFTAGVKTSEWEGENYEFFDRSANRFVGSKSIFSKDGSPNVALDGKFTEIGDQELFVGKIRYLSEKGERLSFEGRSVGGKIDNGTLTYRSGASYKGKFVNNKFNGFGTLKFVNGDLYEGDFVNGMRTGKGKFTFMSNGSIYVGEFVDGKQHGNGVYIDKNGKRTEASFVSGQRVK